MNLLSRLPCSSKMANTDSSTLYFRTLSPYFFDGFKLPKRRNAQLYKQAFDEFRSIWFEGGKDPWHILQSLQDRRQQVKRNRYKLLTFRKQLPSLHAMAETGHDVIQFPGDVWINKNPRTSYRGGAFARPHLSRSVAHGPEQNFCLARLG